MGFTYPPAPATVSGNTLTIHQFLKDPVSVAKRIHQLADARLIADKLLTGSITTDSGAVAIETPAEIDASADPQEIAPGGEYPLVSMGEGALETIEIMKRGFDSEITDESISRRKMDPVEQAFASMIARMVRTIDALALSAIASATVKTRPAIAKWDDEATARILRDVLLSKADLTSLETGLSPNLLVVSDTVGAYLASDERVSKLLAREDKQAPVYTGTLGQIGDVAVMQTSHLPNGSNAILADTTRLGAMADENLHSPGYSTAPGSKIQVKTIRNEEADKYRVRVRRMTVPVILEADAAIEITDVA